MRIVRGDEIAPELSRWRDRDLFQDPEVSGVVARVLADVRARGNEALLANARQFDAPGLTSVSISAEEIASATIAPEEEAALRLAADRIWDFHSRQLAALTVGWNLASRPGATPSLAPLGLRPDRQEDGGGPAREWTHTTPIGTLGQRMRPVDRAGVYVPGGRATYPSSVLMNAIPALVAGVPEVVVVSPAQPDGNLPAGVLVAARILGITEIHKIGGAAAAAAMAFGTDSIRRADVLVGPGNRYLTEAKRQLWGRIGLDGFAGPSEVCVVADETAHPAWAAADLLSQIEHAPDNQGWLVCTDEKTFDNIRDQIEKQTESAPRREILRESLTQVVVFITENREQIAEILNVLAPEHLTLSVRDPEVLSRQVRNAGCILLGDYTPESAGDYVLGPSHTLPTAGAARFSSPLNVMHFLKFQSVSRLTPEGLAELAPAIETIGKLEGFPAHAAGATIRHS